MNSTDIPAAPDRIAPSGRFARFATRFWPAPVRVDARERWRAILGAALGLVITALVSRWWAASPLGPAQLFGVAGLPFLVAPLGASAVLIFAVPASPLAQPWAVVGGNTLSALVGVACSAYIADPAVAASVAVGVAIAVMFAARCLHPPGGATALLAALAAPGLQFAAFPIFFDSLLLVVAGVIYNRLTGRRYPHGQGSHAPAGGTGAATRFTTADLDAALSHYNQVLDVSRDDLEDLLHHAESAAYQRNFGDLRCADIMSREPVTAQFGSTLEEAWALMQQRRIKALPVVDRARRIVGIVTVADFMRHAAPGPHGGVRERLKALVRTTGSVHSDKPEVVGQIMTREVRVASADRRLSELVPLFSDGGHHHIPVIDAEQRLAGIITQTDLVRALYRAAQPAA